MKDLEYVDRLRVWGLTSLEERRVRGDLIQFYKVKNSLETISWFTGPQLAPSSQTRSASNNSYRLLRESFPSKDKNDYGHFVSVRHEFFLNRVVERWNKLSNSQILSPCLNSFKAHVD